MRLGVATVLVLLANAPSAHGFVLFGTEDAPELPPSGPPEYWDGYIGDRDHDHLEILAGWFAYDGVTNEVIWTLKTAEGGAYASPPPDWEPRCSLTGNVTAEGQVQGQLVYSWGHSQGADEAVTRVTFYQRAGVQSGETNVGQSVPHAIDHGFEGRFDEPAYFQFRVDRSDLLEWGDAITDFQGACTETYLPPTGHRDAANIGRVTLGFVAVNRAASESSAEYSFTSLTRVRGPEGELDPVEAYERTHEAPTTEGTGASLGEETPAVGAALTLLGIAVLAGVAASRRRGRS